MPSAPETALASRGTAELPEPRRPSSAIVAPASENIREVLTSGGDALLFALDDEAALFAALDRLVADASLREKLGKSARESLLRQGFTWAENAARVERIAARLMEERK